MSPYPHLFAPFTLGTRTLSNRIVSTAHGTGFAPDGRLTEDYLEYHLHKAAGGVGLTMAFGSASVHHRSTASYGSVSLWDPRNEAMLARLADGVHARGGLVMAQASHLGRRGNSLSSGIPIGAPSEVPEPVHGEIPHVLSTGEIADIVAGFAGAAERLARCGWDGIEITSYGGHLIEQFWSPVTNLREDHYGGTFDNRMRFAEEILAAVAGAVPADFLIGIRLSGDPGRGVVGLGPEEMREIAARLEARGRVDVFNVSGSTGATLTSQAGTVPPDTYPSPAYEDLAAGIREVVSAPVIAAGRYLDLATADAAIERGAADLVAMTRALIADPDLPRHGRAGMARRARPCIAINDACIGRLYTGLPIRCAVNPTVGHAGLSRRQSQPAEQVRTVAVVGGGPAGLEAARTAATRGHRVVLFEAGPDLGGQMLAARQAPSRPHLGGHIEWLAGELDRLRVEVRLHTEARVEHIVALAPEEVIIATGAETVLPAALRELPAVTDEDVLLGRAGCAGSRVLVYDREGEIRGGSIAVFAAQSGAAEVELVTPLASVCAGLDPTQLPSMRRDLAAHGVRCTPDEELESTSDGPVLRNIWSDRTRGLDSFDLIVSVGFRSARTHLGTALESELGADHITWAGDCVAPRRLYDAVYEGAAAGTV